MNIVELPLVCLHPAHWNPNTLAPPKRSQLKSSVTMFDIVENLVVRVLANNTYEVLSGNQRLEVYREMGLKTAPCVVVDLSDAEARLLAQVLNRLHGEDDLGLKAELVRTVLAELPEAEVLKVLPETAESLRDLSELGQQDLTEQLRASQQAQAARLKHVTFQLATDQLEVVEEAMERAMAGITGSDSNPNRRGSALFALCKSYLEGTRVAP